MPTPRADRKYLILAAIVPYAGDIAMTLFGQPAAYWSGEPEAINEANPVAHLILSVHPAAFVIGATLYGGAIAALIYFVPRIIGWWMSVAALLAHSGGMKSWIPHFASWESYSVWEGILNGVLAALATWCYLRSAQVARLQPPTAPHSG